MTIQQFNEIITNEGNYHQFYHCDFFCYMKRHDYLKHWCGYITLTKDNKLHKCYNLNTGGWLDIPIPIHGGWTYDYIDGENYNIGFDCAHWGDLNYSAFLREVPKNQQVFSRDPYTDTYRTKEFVTVELKNACEQLQKFSISRIRAKIISEIL